MPSSIMAQPGYPAVSLNAAALAGPGTTCVLPSYRGTGQPRKFSWDVVIAGGPPASVQVDLQGSDDNINWVQVDTYNVVANTSREIVDKSKKFYRANLIAIGSGGGTVTSSIYCP